MAMVSRIAAASLLSATLLPAVARAQAAPDQSAANNPLTPKITFNLHDYYTPELSGLPGREANQLLLRGLIPHRSFGLGQLFRFTLPLATAPDGSSHKTDIGDLTLMDLMVFRAGKIEIGAGPILVAPTAGSRVTGTGTWQAGAAGILIAPQKWGLIGGLATWQHSFAGKADRADVSAMTVQPIMILNLPQGFYLRSTATWSFDLERKADFIPLGLGAGKVWQAGGTTINMFAEPQYSVWNDGPGTPQWQIFFGVTLQFALKKTN